jgi:hypothetical protein
MLQAGCASLRGCSKVKLSTNPQQSVNNTLIHKTELNLFITYGKWDDESGAAPRKRRRWPEER